MKNVLFCPGCRKLVEAKDYMNPLLLGALDSILPRITCKCGYSGLPLEMSRAGYAKWVGAKKGAREGQAKEARD